MKSMKTRTTFVALAIALPLSLAACGSSTSSTTTPAAGSTPMATSSDSMTSSTPSDSMTTSESMDAASAVFGEGCAAVPKDGKGSFTGMATDPVATAASNNPLLSTLVTAVKEAGLVDTLNSAPEITVFAPTNDAFAKIPAADLKKVLADKPTLTKILTNHVVAGKLSPDQLAGDHKTLAGTTITVKGSGENFTVGKMDAKVICGNVPTANATVYIVDSVLMP
ncbi:putative surface protein with fasciclin (FAS1) repeats [Humibacillus xanthopallidus]|uniref:Putative surface protein with fasciclin (FAS1) repeats n=1 Tax=Humibacillus xanthopallidus TaxID=412689 RepID=A0A543PKI7_9MICO|nr:fasciclin domain-containing protein [Humibacillus xanthopallidus]TQN44592.1 putative surface protein with fasciclin (FAS1) repeats [Humibacillus xanthopallidus]